MVPGPTPQAAGGNNCLEAADNFRGCRPVRGSKLADGSVVTFSGGAWATFVGCVMDGALAGG